MGKKNKIDVKRPKKGVVQLAVFDSFVFIDREKYQKGMEILTKADISDEVKKEIVSYLTTKYSGVKSNAMSKYIVDRGIKPKKYKDNIEEIKKDLETMSQREVAKKWDCSTRTIYLIKKNSY